MSKDKLLIVCGPTATGKTALAIKLAQRFNGELINADSRQVYRGMDVITGKDLPVNSKFKNLRQRRISLGLKNSKITIGYREKDGVPIWLVDVVNPDYTFNVGEYQKVAHLVVEDVIKRNKFPIIVGGTGLYIKSIISPMPYAAVVPDEKLRHKLSRQTLSELKQTLKQADQRRWEQMNSSDRANHRRLIRAIEIAQTPQNIVKSSTSPQFNICKVGLTAEKKDLYNLIDKRVESRLQEGALDEVSKIQALGYSIKLPSLTATGYSQMTNYLEGKLTMKEALQKWKFAEHAYARRQMTWFKKDSKIHWFDILDPFHHDKIEQIVRKWYTPH